VRPGQSHGCSPPLFAASPDGGRGEGHEHGEVQHGVAVGRVGRVDAEVAVAGECDLDVSKAVHARVVI
jgi:hypothetical protein